MQQVPMHLRVLRQRQPLVRHCSSRPTRPMRHLLRLTAHRANLCQSMRSSQHSRSRYQHMHRVRVCLRKLRRQQPCRWYRSSQLCRKPCTPSSRQPPRNQQSGRLATFIQKHGLRIPKPLARRGAPRRRACRSARRLYARPAVRPWRRMLLLWPRWRRRVALKLQYSRIYRFGRLRDIRLRPRHLLTQRCK